MALSIRRYEQIAAILVKYGFEVAVVDLLPNTIQWRLHKQKTDTVNLSVNRRLRLAIQELGPTFVKFGQIMSTRRELISAELVEELKQLTDNVEPVPWVKVKPTIEEYCGPIGDMFVYLNERPFAAASLSQAHHGKLKDGTVVVLKVQRPGIREVIETDLHILKSIADRAEKTSSELQIFNFPAMVTDFARQIMAELDFVRDGKNADLLARNMKGFERVRVPRIYWEHSGQRLLVMEYMKGVRIDKVEQIGKMGVDPKAIALLGFNAYTKQIFEDGFFHGDPHPGNLLVTTKGELVFLDFGLIGVLRPEKRDLLLKMLMSIVDKDVDGLVDVFTALGIRVRDQWVDAFKDDLYLALMEGEQYSAIQPDSGAVEGVVEALRKYRIRVPMVTMLMIKVILMVQEDAYRLYPEFDYIKEIKPLLGDTLRKRLLSQANIRKAGFDILDAFRDAKDLPSNINSALKRLSQGSFTFKIAHDDLDRLGNSIDRASYKILLGLVMASIVIGMSLVVLATQSVLSAESFQLTVAIYALAVFVGIFSVVQLIRERDKR
ncbi:MAG: AarF/UbiB family protein [Candidatus Bathyarchaeota archaeon]|nr:AarF/UbiB family protein [Candidatus Bathyarchaeota archaeon]